MQEELNIHALECFMWSYINRIIFLAHKQEEPQPPCAKEPPGTAELGQTPLPDLDSLLLLLIQIRRPR